MKQPNPNLWSVSWASNLERNGEGDPLWICAASAGVAESKARRVLKKLGHRSIAITEIKHSGTIDAF